MTIWIPYDPPNWNEYIKLERASYYASNSLKQKEKRIVSFYVREKKWDGGYPVQITFRPHFDGKRKDLDNTRVKGILDGLVSAGVLKNDNLTCIQRIVTEPVFDDRVGIEIEIEEM